MVYVVGGRGDVGVGAVGVWRVERTHHGQRVHDADGFLSDGRFGHTAGLDGGEERGTEVVRPVGRQTG